MALKVELCSVRVVGTAHLLRLWLAFANLLEPTHIGDELNEIGDDNSATATPIRVALVEAPSLMRDGISRLLEGADITLEWVGDSLSGLVESGIPIDVVILDFDLVGNHVPTGDISLVGERLASVLLCGGTISDLQRDPLAGAGIAGAVPKSAGFEELLVAVQTIAAGGTWLTPSARDQVPATALRLSSQQTEVLRRYAAGLKLATVARQLRISPNTVSYHLRMIRQKSEQIGVRATTQRDMLRLAQRLGIEPMDANS